jgi:rhamnosyltransferase subunit B
MARILIHTFGSAGDVNPYIGLALALQRRGHRPLLAMSSLFRESIEAAGLELHAVRPDIDLSDTGLLRRVMDPARGTETIFAELVLPMQPDWPPHTLVTGPVLYNGAAPSSVPAALETFLAGGPPPLVFTLGTSAVESAGTFYEVSAEVARRLGQRAVLLIGRHPHNRPVAVGDDALVLEYAPHDAVFARASVIVHQGGAGTLHQALRAGRPTLVVPHAHDQADNARRLASLGVSRTVSPRQYRVAAVERALHALLHDTGAAQRSREVAAVVAAEPGAAAACDAIEAVLARGAGQGVL